jgi:hypothetical protein
MIGAAFVTVPSTPPSSVMGASAAAVTSYGLPGPSRRSRACVLASPAGHPPRYILDPFPNGHGQKLLRGNPEPSLGSTSSRVCCSGCHQWWVHRAWQAVAFRDPVAAVITSFPLPASRPSLPYILFFPATKDCVARNE